MKARFPKVSGGALVGLTLTVSCLALTGHAAVTVPAPDTAPAATQTPAPALAPQPGDITADDFTQDARILGELARRKAALDRREHELELREAQVSAAELLARREVSQLSTLRGEVEKIVNQQTGDASADLSMLANLFSNMKPIQAAAIMGKLEIPKAAAILRRLDTRMAGPVLAAMDPTIAAGVTQELERAHSAFQDASADTPAAKPASQ